MVHVRWQLERMPHLQRPGLGFLLAHILLQACDLPVEALHLCFELLSLQAPVCKEADEVLLWLRAPGDDVKARGVEGTGSGRPFEAFRRGIHHPLQMGVSVTFHRCSCSHMLNAEFK